jgi:glycosidase
MNKTKSPKRLRLNPTPATEASILRTHLTALYGEAAGQNAYQRLRAKMARFAPRLAAVRKTLAGVGCLTQRDAILITYADQVQSPNRLSLKVLADFCKKHLRGVVNGIHILPFYPWSSDDGFSVKRYRAVDRRYGNWQVIDELGQHFRLMFDAVINHISAESAWFRGFLRGDPRYQNYFIVVEGRPDLSQVVRPRALPLLTTFKTSSGEKKVWTTFSDDQIDLNYRNPDVLLEIMDTLLSYAAHGAQFIRLDAIAYLWKEIGSSCIHLPQTHRIIQFLRAVLDEVAPYVRLITETNVPHADNISYFGDGYNEAQMVYNFALPPLVLHTFHTGNARALTSWASTLSLPSDQATFFNFLASHDGIGLNPTRGLLPQGDIDGLVARTLEHGGLVSYKNNPDGTRSPYELNINYFDALSNPNGREPIKTRVDRFMAAQAIMLALVGVPGIYFHSLFGSRGWPEGVRQTGRSRTINRQKLSHAELKRELANPKSLRHIVFSRHQQLLQARAASPAFHPHGMQHILDCGDGVFAVLRRAPHSEARVVCLHNVSSQPQEIRLAGAEFFGLAPKSGGVADLITGQKRFSFHRENSVRLRPYETWWLTHESNR